MGLLVFKLDEFVNVASTLKLCDKNCVKGIFAFQDIMKRKRDEQILQNRKLSSEIYKSIKSISLDVHDSKKLKNIDISHLRENLKTVQENILRFKTQNDVRLKKLKEEEKFLTLKMEEFERLLSNYDETPLDLKTVQKTKACSSSSLDQEKHENVLNYESFLIDNGGHSGGWEEEDHLLFLQFIKKFKVKSEFLNALKVRLPGISERDILKHEKWYSDYLFLREKQRLAVKKWRTDKEVERTKCRSSSDAKIVKSRKVDEHSITERKQKLEEWKQRKLEKEMEAKEEVRKAIKDKREKASEKKQMQEMKRAAVEIYKKEKICKQNASLLKKEFKELKERGERAAQANMLLKTFRQNDETYIERRRLSRARKLDEEKLRSEESRRLSIRRESAQRDPERLLRPTLAWQDRLQSKEKDSAAPKPILHLRNLPRFATPNWRKGLPS